MFYSSSLESSLSIYTDFISTELLAHRVGLIGSCRGSHCYMPWVSLAHVVGLIGACRWSHWRMPWVSLSHAVGLIGACRGSRWRTAWVSCYARPPVSELHAVNCGAGEL